MRGENEELAAKIDRIHGSSPHARGKLHVENNASTREGLIPACAGKTVAPAPATVASKAHPRMRGENTLYIVGV